MNKELMQWSWGIFLAGSIIGFLSPSIEYVMMGFVGYIVLSILAGGYD